MGGLRWTPEQHADWLEKHGTPAPLQHVDVSTQPFRPPLDAKQRMQALGRLPAGTMNKTEAAYDAYLRGLSQVGEVLWHKFEAVKLRLADKTFYTGDFLVLSKDGVVEVHEVKGGYWQEDSRVKIKVAASIYPFRFFGVMPIPKSKGGGWKVEEF